MLAKYDIVVHMILKINPWKNISVYKQEKIGKYWLGLTCSVINFGVLWRKHVHLTALKLINLWMCWPQLLYSHTFDIDLIPHVIRVKWRCIAVHCA